MRSLFAPPGGRRDKRVACLGCHYSAAGASEGKRMRAFYRLAVIAVFGSSCIANSPAPPADMAMAPDLALTGDLNGFDLTMGGAECTDPRATPYKPNLVQTTAKGAFTVTLLVSEPGPPIMGSNAW